MQILSYTDIDSIAETVLELYERQQCCDTLETDILAFASDFLNLTVSHATLSPDGTLLGITTFAETPCEIWTSSERELFWVPPSNILIDTSLTSKDNRARERFTIAHECAHQYLHRADFSKSSDGRKAACRLCDGLTHHKLKTADDWLEWQANSFASSLLLPKNKLHEAFVDKIGAAKLQAVYGTLLPSETKGINELADCFGVSFTTMTIRLEQLGYIVGWHFHSVRSPLTIYCDEQEVRSA